MASAFFYQSDLLILPIFDKNKLVLTKLGNDKLNIGLYLKSMRLRSGKTLHQMAVSTDIDSTIISKIERGVRLPTSDQLKMFSNYFDLPFDDLNAVLVAEKIIKNYGLCDVTYKAIQIIEEEFSKYISKRKDTAE